MLDDLSPKMLHAMQLLGVKPGAIVPIPTLRAELGPRFRSTLKALNRRHLVALDFKAVRGDLGYSGWRMTATGAADFAAWQKAHEVSS